MRACLLVDNRDQVQVVTTRVGAGLIVHRSNKDQFGSRREQHWGGVQQLARCTLMVSSVTNHVMSAQESNAFQACCMLLAWHCHACGHCAVRVTLQYASTKLNVKTVQVHVGQLR